ncbi:restriction endonuclease subunit S [Glaesserella parasuis]|uniref:Type I site-specific deoxyribonuclease S subunit, restriction modification system n=11 Tax=Glaesserella parasuis TaxID=738 RepID=B8F7Y1_GLAP5|nr:restriction endonuclease subunit S [Glaesserella parasuis]ACL33433.1 type I site-specific deoxyribonuclease S subunit, restriction modification system [Glaesserella parasuis SH0165]MWP86396.1 restriction endonuclease subunit S [Glaesserella parasuis]MWP90509.1 restriction endonuclease subunit S [Glaesserella parasuis]MWP96571.1 restriction endonuclease subunit S [Glaesserella parasuis]MWQ29531.1 restriction endonuclease subunit S [Glaesserella parasuis]
MTNLNRNGITLLLDDLKFVNIQSNSADGKRTSLQANDILISITTELGKIGFIPENFGEAYINQHTALIRIDPNKAHAKFIAYVLSSATMNKTINSLNDAGAKAGLNLPTIKALSLKLPSIEEQIQIAETLSTWDNAIQTTEKLLENSRQQKKALMQRLLKGNNWLQTDLAELAVISKGSQLNKNTLSDNGQYAVINGGIEPSGYTDKFNTESHTITISEGGNSCGYIGFQKEKFWCGGHCYALSNLRINCLFLYQLLKYNEENIMRLRVGSGLPNIQKKALESFSLSYPQDISEQQKIAEILSTADQEIETLQRKLECLKLEKGALMQRVFI